MGWMRWRSAAFPGLGLILMAGAAPGQAGDHGLFAMTPERFRAAVVLKDDGLDVAATLSTEKGWRRKQGLLGVVHDDNFLRAIIDKKTGKARIQVYQWIVYQGPWRDYFLANYVTGDGAASVRLDRLDRRIITECRRKRERDACRKEEDFAFDISETLLRGIAGMYVPNDTIVWPFKFKARGGGPDLQGGFAPAEAAGLVLAIDDYRRTRGLNGVE